MIDRYVVSKSQMIRIPCDGPLTAQVERCKLEESMRASGKQPDVDIEYVKQPRPQARANARRKQNTKRRYK